MLVALIISISITSVFYLRVRRVAGRAQTKKVVAAAVDLPTGTPLTAEKLTKLEWPESVPLEGSINNLEEVVGRVLLYPVGAKEPIRKRDLAGANSGIGLTAKIPDGMRAVAVKTNEVTNVAGFLFPGCRVDVLVTLRKSDSTITRTVLQDVLVLSAGKNTEPDPQGKPENVNVITVLATPEESQKLFLATNQGSIHFVLRNGGDKAVVDTPPISLTELAGGPEKAAPAAPVAVKRAPLPKVRAAYLVETVSGDKTSVTKFE